MTGRRVAWPSLSSPPALTHRTPTKRSALRLRGGHRTPLVAYAPSLSWAPPRNSEAAIAPSLRGGLEFSIGLQILSLPNQGNLESGIFHGTDYTGHNKIKTLPICRPDLLVGNTSVPTL